MKLKIIFWLLLSFYILNSTSYIDAQAAAPTKGYTQQTDTNTTKPIQYRRGIELREGYQSYEQYYEGKDMAEEKRSHFPLSGTGTWTELNPKVPRVDYFGIDFINPDTGWACGGSGAIIKTTNGGDDWTIAETPTTNLLLKIHSYNGQVVIATGYDGLILRSSDGGETFEQVTSGVGSGTDLWGVQMLNDTLGWVCGLNQTLLKTTDGGLNWLQVFPGLNQHYWSLNFLDESYGMIACGGGIVLKTTDGGNNWVQIQAGDIRSLYTIDIIDSIHIAAAGGSFGKNVYSSDGGETWVQNSDLPYSDGANWIQFIDTDTGYITGGGSQLMKTTNRGQTWITITLYFDEGDWQFELTSSLTGYGTGSRLTLTKTVNGFENWFNLIMNDDFSDVFFSDEFTGYIAGGSYIGGPVYKTTNAGENWSAIAGFPTNLFTTALASLTFTDSLTGFVGGAPCRIVKTTDAGNSWFKVNRTGLTDTIGTINKIFFINPTTGWAVTSRGGILKTTDGGENWLAQLNVPFESITSIFFVDSLNGWATSRYIWQTTDGGVNWIQQTYLPSDSHDDVYFTNKDTGWISHYSSINTSLFKTTDGGENWLDIDDVIGARKFYFFPDPIHWIILGFSRYYITIDSGLSWIEFTGEVPMGLNSFNSPNNNLGFGVGSTGLILKYEDTTYIPVEFISFSAESHKGSIELKWIIATETNNNRFEVLRSNDNKNWDIVGFVPGNGTTTILHTYQYTDEVKIAGNYYYKLKQVDYNGEFDFSNTIEAQVVHPSDFILYQNFPNPFNPTTEITFEIPIQSEVKIILYDITGQEIKTITNQKYETGFHSVILNTDDLSSGVYLYRMTTQSGYTAVKKLTIIK